MENLSEKLNNIPEIEFLENRFHFIRNADLRTNLSISFQYVIFLITIEEELTLQGPVSYSIFKNMVLNTAAIVEGSLHYLLDELIRENQVDPNKIFSREEKYTNKKVLFKTEKGVEICGIHVTKKPARLRPNTNFQEINRASRRAKLLSQKLFEDVEELREKRNKIHLAGLKKEDDFFDKKDIQKAFNTASSVLTLVEKKLAINE